LQYRIEGVKTDVVFGIGPVVNISLGGSIKQYYDYNEYIETKIDSGETAVGLDAFLRIGVFELGFKLFKDSDLVFGVGIGF
jgi:hypothetical protein